MISMSPKRPLVWVILLLAAATVAGIAFVEGMFYANRRATIRMANYDCFDCWAGLSALTDTNSAKLAQLLNREMDLSALRLANMSLKYPRLIQRIDFNILVRVRDYRKKYGRPLEQLDYDPGEVDLKIAEAIAYMQTQHNTNEWLPFKTAYDDILLQSKHAR